jgi:hypothetical protein
MFRHLTSLIVILGLVCMAAWTATASAKDKTHEGKVVKAGDGKLTMTLQDGKKQHTHDVAKNAKVTLDGKEAKLEDLKEGMSVTVTSNDTNMATVIEARSPKKDSR